MKTEQTDIKSSQWSKGERHCNNVVMGNKQCSNVADTKRLFLLQTCYLSDTAHISLQLKKVSTNPFGSEKEK